LPDGRVIETEHRNFITEVSRLGAAPFLNDAKILSDPSELGKEVEKRLQETRKAAEKWRDRHVKCRYKAFYWLQKSLTTFSNILDSYGGIIEIVKQVEPKFGYAYNALSVFLVVSEHHNF